LIGHDPLANLKDVFERLPTLEHRDLAQLLPQQLATTDRNRYHRAHHSRPTDRRIVFSTRHHRWRKDMVRATHSLDLPAALVQREDPVRRKALGPWGSQGGNPSRDTVRTPQQ
jgi:hypothetical protein